MNRSVTKVLEGLQKARAKALAPIYPRLHKRIKIY